MTLILLFVLLILFFSLFSARFEKSIITAPIVFTTAGFLASLFIPELHTREEGLKVFLTLAEIGLVLLLFSDASRTNLNILRNIKNLPVRLLSTGMLLTILLGGLSALVVFQKLNIWEAGILAAILAPTDAGLGQIIVNSPRVPMKIRQALNVEAGLNDGLSVPFLLFFIALASTHSGEDKTGLAKYIIEQLGYGVVMGVVIGLAGGYLFSFFHRKKCIAHSWSQLGVVVLPLLCVMVSEDLGASMFIAAFVAGLSVQVGYKEAGKQSVEFTEQWGQIINLSVFFLFGLLVAMIWNQFDWTYLLYAVLSLTIVRMLPVAIALVGTKLSKATVLFMGWFGPRGLASIVLGLVFLEHNTQIPGESTIRLAVMLTVLISIFAHGLSAMPGINIYSKKMQALPPTFPENEVSTVD
jgi:NhaP-type Na+/H+ or K+/H+ antiporter